MLCTYARSCKYECADGKVIQQRQHMTLSIATRAAEKILDEDLLRF